MPALSFSPATPWRKVATRRQVCRYRQLTGNSLDSGGAAGTDLRNTGQQACTIGMLWTVKQALGVRFFQQSAAIHDQDVAAALPDHCQVMADEQNSRLVPGLQSFQLVQD